jgi:serine protease
MRKSLFSFITGLLISAGIFAQTAVPDYVDGKIYLKYKQNAKIKINDPTNIDPKTMPGLADLIGKYGINFAEKPFYQATDSKDLMRIYKIGFSNLTQVESFIRDIASNPLVEYAEKVPLMKCDYIPNDPNFFGGATNANNWHLIQIGAMNAWNVYNGTSNGSSTITVAVVDNAIQYTHTDLTTNIWVNPGEIAGNFIDDDGNGYVDDVRGYDVGDNDNVVSPLNNSWSHGTHCSGIVAARTDNTVGIAAIGFNLKIMPVKATANSAGSTVVSNGYGGIIYAARSEAKVISCSWGGTGSAVSDQAVVDYAWNRGCIVIAAAGNSGNNTNHYPGAYNNVYCVASTNSSDVKSSFSNYGTWVDISAPGDNIYSTVPSNAYQAQSGTSMATPMVAGLAGLMLAKNPYMTPTAVLNCISSTAASSIYTISGNSAYVSGNQLGAGRINAASAMNCASVAPGSPPIADFLSNKQITCPGNPINFYDLSLYYPTAWSWSFQSGSPATSTSSVPVVTWTAAGTYSVSLTATNAFGNGSITKTAYITISNPGTLPLVEGFQGATWPPTNWFDDNKFNDSIRWERATNAGGFGTSSASLLFDNYFDDASGTRDEFNMPKLNMTGVSSARLRFDVAYSRYDATYSDSLQVRLSTNCGLTWTSIYLKGGTTLATAADYTVAMFVPTSTQWRRDSIDITALAAGQGNVLMSFVNRGHWGQAIYVDNVNLAYTVVAVPSASYNTPANICSGSAVTFTDASTNAPNSWSWTLPGASPATSTLQSPSVTYSAGGVYQATLTATNGAGSNSTIKSITVTASPTVTPASSGSACAGLTKTLTVTGTASTYTWNPGAFSGTTYTVNPGATTLYTVSGTTGSCTRTSTINLTVTPNPTVSVNSLTICAGSNTTLTASGATSYSWNTGQSTAVINPAPLSTTVYTVTGTTSGCTNVKTTTITVNPNPTVTVNSSTVCSGSAASLTAGGATTYSWNTGATTTSISVTPTITTVYTVTGTTTGCTNVRTTTVTVNPTPTVAVNNLTICAGSNTTLTASGATSYSWNTGQTTAVINPAPLVTTVYTVTGTTSGCTNVKTSTITVNPNPTVTVNSASVCGGSSANLSASGAATYSWNTGATTTSISVSPSITTVYTVTGTSSGCTNVKTTTVTVTPSPTVSVNSTTICTGQPANLIAGGATTYSWNTGAATSSIVVAPGSTTVYTVTGTTGGCINVKTSTVTVNSLPSLTLSASQTTICTTTSGGSTLALTGSPSGGVYAGTGVSGSTFNSQASAGTYTATYSYTNSTTGCSNTAFLNISVNVCTGINSVSLPDGALTVYPNPNNGVFTIKANVADAYSLSIYNNIGQLIIENKTIYGSADINLVDHGKGIYNLLINYKDENKTVKVIVE